MLMSELSPAAQAVITAWRNVIKADNYGGRVEVPIAAALRAAATAIGAQEMFHPDSKRTEGVKWCVQNIYTIADELEGVKYGTYRCDLEKNG
jgi:hypothetical protein